MTTPTGKAMASMLAGFAEFERDILRERVLAGIAHSKAKGIRNGRPPTARSKYEEVLKLKSEGMNHVQIAKKLRIVRTSVIRFIQESKREVGTTLKPKPLKHHSVSFRKTQNKLSQLGLRPKLVCKYSPSLNKNYKK